MAQILPPPPILDQPGSYVWMEWYQQLRNYISQSGSVPWSVINFQSSDISDIVTRNHNNLQTIQGGTTGEYYHLTNAELTKVTNLPTSTVNAIVPLAKITSGGTNGSLTIVNGVITAYVAPT